MFTNQAVVWFSLAAVALVALWLTGWIRSPLQVVGLAGLAAIFLASRWRHRDKPARPATLRSLVFHMVAMAAIGIHLFASGVYLILIAMSARAASEGDRLLLTVITTMGWLAVFGLGVALWLARRWLIVSIPVLSVLVLFLMSRVSSSLPAVPIPTPHPHRPATVGVILEREDFGQGNRMGRVTLESGETFSVHLDRDRRGDDPPTIGDLLLAGQASDGRWFYAFPGSESGSCFRLRDYHATDLGETIRFSFGLELPKADGYESGYFGPALSSPTGVHFCVDGHGEVTSATPA